MVSTTKQLSLDEWSLIFEYLGPMSRRSNLDLSLVNRNFNTLASSDNFWQKFYEEDKELSRYRQKEANLKRLIISERRKKCIDNNDTVRGCCYFLVFVAIISIFPFGILGFVSLSFTSRYQVESFCNRRLYDVWREQLNDTIPTNGTCLSCDTSQIVSCTINTTTEFPTFFPCCWMQKACLYDKIPSSRYLMHYYMNMSIRQGENQYYDLNIYECTEGTCKANNYQNYNSSCVYDVKVKVISKYTYNPVSYQTMVGLLSGGAFGTLVMLVCVFPLCLGLAVRVCNFSINLNGLVEENIISESIEEERVKFRPKRGRLYYYYVLCLVVGCLMSINALPKKKPESDSTPLYLNVNEV